MVKDSLNLKSFTYFRIAIHRNSGLTLFQWRRRGDNMDKRFVRTLSQEKTQKMKTGRTLCEKKSVLFGDVNKTDKEKRRKFPKQLLFFQQSFR